MTINIKSDQWHVLPLGRKQDVPFKLPQVISAYIECRSENIIPSEAKILLGDDPITQISNLYFPPESTPIAWKLGATKCEKPDLELANIVTDAPGL